jgi:uncharacterized iron-regulated protein
MSLMKRVVLLILIVIPACALLVGCLRRETLPPWTSSILALKPPVEPDEIYTIPEGEKISFDQLITRIDSSKVIFVGEAHDQIEHHHIQLRILQGLLAKGKEVVVAMEMFHRSQQPVLDRWSQGGLKEREFRKETNWDVTWGIDYQLYRGILDEARNRHLKVLALNVDREWVSHVAKNGIKGLSPEDRNKLPEMDLSDKEHRTYIRRIYNNHRGGLSKDFERFYESQALWDEGMAETLSEFLKSPESQGKTILVIAGNGHIVFDFGIPKRFYRRTPFPFRTLVMKEWTKEADQDLVSPPTSAPLADFLWVTRSNPPEQKRPRIGIFLKEKDEFEGLWIERVVPGGPAEKAGLLSGDRLIAVEGKEISEVTEIHDALSRKGWGKEISMTVLRDGSQKEITVTLPAQND